PRLYEEVRERVKAGQFIPEGAVYVESDTNLVGGESLIRQFVLGKRWFREEFGVDSRMAWMPDTFGFTASLPQIMAGCRVDYFATQKLLRCDPECEQFPYNVFWWEGIDGTRILSHIYKKNNAVFNAGALRERWEKDRNQREDIDGLIFPFGYGDGGGGPTELMVETARRCVDLEGAPRCRMESPVAFFEKQKASSVKNVYYGELYLAWHRGTYTAQAGIKKGVRKAEYALREAEYLAGLLRLTGKTKKKVSGQKTEEEITETLESLWKKLLLQEFHDILPGSSIQRVNEEAREALAAVERESRRLAEELLGRLAGGAAWFNSLSWERTYRGLQLPSCGYRMITEEDSEQLSEESDPFSGSQLVFTNSYYRAEVDSRGRIVSLTNRENGYEYVAAPLNDWKLYKDVNVDYDAWELGRMYDQVPVEFTGECSFLAERDLRGGVIVTTERREQYFTVRQKIYFATDSPRIDFATEVDWHERHRILKVDFPTTIFTREILEEIQFGYIRRPTHKSRQYERDLYETCHHKYAVLSDGENGFAVLNDCKYGLSAENSRMSLTLLRAPVIPDMTADQGVHTFTYSILPFSGPFVYSRVTEEAYECNVPVTEWKGAVKTEMPKSVSFFKLEGGHAVLETCKPAFDEANGVILRIYEAKGCAGTTMLTVPAGVKHIFCCNMLEEKQEELELKKNRTELKFRAFEIKTILLEI
ncbi:MAG: alpha-mannosidase, partial [Acetatifactor sp.]